jgi:hypothetical protein
MDALFIGLSMILSMLCMDSLPEAGALGLRHK